MSEPKPRYVWDPKKLAWVETTEAETAKPVIEKAAVEPKPEEVPEEAIVETRAEEVSSEVTAEVAPAAQAAVEPVGPQYKGPGIRLAAFVVDLLVLLVISIILGQVPGVGGIVNSVTSEVGFAAWQQWMYMGIVTVYFVGFWTWRGQTPGKMLTGLKIVKTDGSPIGIRRAVLRFVVFFLYLMLWAAISVNFGILFAIIIGALIITAFNKKRKGIHDFIAGTVVINSRPPKPAPVAVAEPVEVSEAAEASSAGKESEPPGASEPETEK